MSWQNDNVTARPKEGPTGTTSSATAQQVPLLASRARVAGCAVG